METSLRAGAVCVLACLLCFCVFGREPYHVERKGSLVNVFYRSDEKPFAIIGPIAKSAALSVEARPGEPFVRFTFGPAKENTDRRLRVLHFPMVRLEGLGDAWELRAQGTAGLTAIDGHPGSFMYLAVAEPCVSEAPLMPSEFDPRNHMRPTSSS